MSYAGLHRCRCGQALSPPQDRRRVRCPSCNNVYDAHWRITGPSQVAKPGSWKREPRQGPFEEKVAGWKYSLEDLERIRWGFVPRAMEDKWLMVVEDEQLFICRSWTGQLCYVAHLSPDGIPNVEISPAMGPPFNTLEMVRDLIDGFLIGEGPGVR